LSGDYRRCPLLGAVIGDIVGSRFEFKNIKTKEFELFTEKCRFTDDTVMSLAVAAAVLDCKGGYDLGSSFCPAAAAEPPGEALTDRLGEYAAAHMREIGREYLHCGYGGMFRQWLISPDPKPYSSFGNGAAMRVSACGFAAQTLEEAVSLSKKVTEVTHNHPEGLKGAEATAVSVFLAREGLSIPEIRDYLNKHYYSLDFTLNEIRASYRFDVTCRGSVPQAVTAFLESAGFEDAVRNAVSIGGDSDTIAAITGGIAEAYYGIPEGIRKQALAFLDERLLKILEAFENTYPIKK
jgi:type I restriction enzyme M protein